MSSATPVDIYTTPAGPPPPGVAPNLIDPYYRLRVFLFTQIACLAVSTVAVALRIFTKLYLMKHFRAEDYALVIAQLGFIAWVALNLAAPGTGHHLWDISIYTSMQLLKYDNYIITLYGPLVFFAKLSVLLQLQHIFVVSRRQPIFFIIQALIWANLAFYLAYLFVDIFQCMPRHKIWEPTVTGHCISTNVLLIAPAGINIVSDILILVLPIVMVFRLNMMLKNRLAISAIFGSGFFAVVSSVMRLAYSIRLTQSTDIFWEIYPVSMWAAAELATVVITATFPTMPRLWAFIRTGDRNSQQYNRSSDRRLAPWWPRKSGQQPMQNGRSSLPRAKVPLHGNYRELRSGDDNIRRKEEALEMAILKTETFEVMSHADAKAKRSGAIDAGTWI